MKKRFFLILMIVCMLMIVSLSVGGIATGMCLAGELPAETEVTETVEENTEENTEDASEEMSSLDVWWKDNGPWISTLVASLSGVGAGIIALFGVLIRAGKRIKTAISGLNDGSMTLDGVKKELKSVKNDYLPELQSKYSAVCGEVKALAEIIKTYESRLAELKKILTAMAIGSSELVKNGVADKIRNMEINKNESK